MTKILFLSTKLDVVAVVEVFAKSAAVLNVAPEEEAFNQTVLCVRLRVALLLVVVRLIPRTLGEVVDTALGALISPIRLLYTFATPEVPKEVMSKPDTVGAPEEVLWTL